MRGKYSPTISMAYGISQKWHDKFAGDNHYDPEGYDSYGYNKDDVDRAGNHEDDYMMAPLEDDADGDSRTFESMCDEATVYEQALVGRLQKLGML